MHKPTQAEIVAFAAENPQMRARDMAQVLGISEGELLAVRIGRDVTRLSIEPAELVTSLTGLGEVMALTRNESAVHEKVGIYDNISVGKGHGLVFNGDIDLRLFLAKWVHVLAVVEPGRDGPKRSIQIFDAHGMAVHKIHLKPQSDVNAFHALVAAAQSSDQTPGMAVSVAEPRSVAERPEVDVEELRRRWQAITDVHQFQALLRKLKLERLDALEMAGQDLAWPLEPSCVQPMLESAATNGLPIMCFVGNHGCIQIHSGPIHTVKVMGPWLNILDARFNLHLRADHVAEVWALVRPTKDGPVTSIEAYDRNRDVITRFFGARKEGEAELPAWAELVAGLPRLLQQTA